MTAVTWVGASSNGLKHALVTSRKSRSALLPKRVDGERSGAIGVRWAALACAKRGHCRIRTIRCATVCGLAPHSGQLVGLWMEVGSVFADEGVAREVSY